MRETSVRHPQQPCNTLTRRELVRAGGVSLLGLGLLDSQAEAAPCRIRAGKAVRCIVLNLTGGMGQVDTWDMKPNAPAAMRGPFRPIPTNVPGMEISEIFPRMARHADKFALARSMHSPATDASGQTRQDVCRTPDASCHSRRPDVYAAYDYGAAIFPSVGCYDDLAARCHPDMPCRVNLPFAPPAVPSAACLPRSSSRLTAALSLDTEPEALRDRYGRNAFGQACLRARRLVERGVCFVSVEMYPDGHDGPTWDAHGSAPFADLTAYRTHCGPRFDNAYVSLIEDLQARGLYDSTIVLATGRWGRAPLVNRHGGRARWPHCWTLLIGGGGLRGAKIIGASDDLGGYPVERPTTPDDIAATLRLALNLEPDFVSAKPRAAATSPALAAQPLFELL